MRKFQAMLLTLSVLLALRAKAQQSLPLKLIATTPLPHLVGDLEFFAVDLKGNRLFLCAEDGKTVEVFNLDTGKWMQSIKDFVAPHDIVFLPDSNKFIVTDGNEGFGGVKLVSGENYKILDNIKLPKDVDAGVFNPVNKYFYVASGSDDPGGKTHLINIIDTKNFKLVGNITLPGSGNNGLALDEANHRLFIATRKPPKFFVFNTDTGKIVATLPCAAYNDHLSFDVL